MDRPHRVGQPVGPARRRVRRAGLALLALALGLGALASVLLHGEGVGVARLDDEERPHDLLALPRLGTGAQGLGRPDRMAGGDGGAPTPVLPRETLRRDLRSVTLPGMMPAPALEGGEIARLPDAEPPFQRKAPPPPRRTAWPLPLAEAAGRFTSSGAVIELAGIEPLPAGALCGGGNWPCGAFARTAFQRLLRQRTVECDPQPDGDGPYRLRCRLGGRDLGLWLIEQGWAAPAERAADGYAAALDAARSAGRGQWGTGPRR